MGSIMGRSRIRPIVTVTICTVILLAACVVVYMLEDRTGPEIMFDSVEIEFQTGDSEEVLLEGVHAFDEQDNDVSSTLRIENVINFEEEGYVIVTYVAKDNSNNITKRKRKISLK